MSQTPSRFSYTSTTSQSSLSGLAIETITLSSDEEDPPIPLPPPQIRRKAQATKTGVQFRTRSIQSQDMTLLEGERSRSNTENTGTSSSSDDDIIIIERAPITSRQPPNFYLGARKSCFVRPPPSLVSSSATASTSRITAVKVVQIPVVTEPPKKSRVKGRAKISDLGISIPLVKLEIQEDDLRDLGDLRPKSIDIRIDELYILSSSLSDSKHDRAFRITVNLTASNLSTKQALSTTRKTRLFSLSPYQPYSTVTTFKPGKPLIISSPPPPSSSGFDKSSTSKYFMEIIIEITDKIQISRKCNLEYDGDSTTFRKLVAISKNDNQGVVFKWKMGAGGSSRTGLESTLENALRLEERNEKEDIARKFEVHCLKDSRPSTLLGGFDPTVDLSFVPHRLPKFSSPLTINPNHSPLESLYLPSPNDLPHDVIPIFTHSSPLFSPLPYYRQIIHSTVAYAFDVREPILTGFPVIRDWYNAEELEKLVERLEEEMVLDTLVHSSVNDVDVGALRRDFAALKTFLESAGIDEARFNREEAFLLAEAESDGEVIERDEEVAAILDMFKRRVGRSAFEVRNLAVFAALVLFFRKKNLDTPIEHYEDFTCQFCGILFCTVHRVDVSASNIPTLISRKGRSQNGKRFDEVRGSCGSDCYRNDPSPSPMDVDWSETSTLLLELILKKNPEMWSCNLVLELDHTCAEIHEKRSTISLTPPSSPKIAHPSSTKMSRSNSNLSFTKSTNKKQEIYRPSLYYGYRPCSHPGKLCIPCSNPPCDPDVCEEVNHCSCLANLTPCDKVCGCPSECPSRFQGCACSSNVNEICKANCPCRKAARECDPDLCNCANKLCINSQIKNHDHASCRLGKSTLPGAGFGLFAGELIREDTLIGTYAGEYFENDTPYNVLQACIAQVPNHVSYVFDIGRGHSLDSHLHGNFTRYINDNGKKENVRAQDSYLNGGLQMAIYAIRDIEEGEEIFMKYGDAYNHEFKV